eukprot:3017734-Pleurochrysis_carterae.AAC.1
MLGSRAVYTFPSARDSHVTRRCVRDLHADCCAHIHMLPAVKLQYNKRRWLEAKWLQGMGYGEDWSAPPAAKGFIVKVTRRQPEHFSSDIAKCRTESVLAICIITICSSLRIPSHISNELFNTPPLILPFPLVFATAIARP